MPTDPSAVTAVALTAVVLAVCAPSGASAIRSLAGGDASSSRNRTGQIAWKGFTRAGDESTAAIYAADPDGSHRRPLTHPAAGVVDDLPDWSPDGSHILFERLFQPTSKTPTAADQVMRITADGTGLRQVGTCTRACVGNDDPQYSPDGRQIVFVRALRVKGSSLLATGVWLMAADGGNPHEVVAATPGVWEVHEPAWSPDGKRIVFTRLNDSASPNNKQALFIVAGAGGTPRQLTPWSLNAGGANWSPDGLSILFQSYRDCACSEISQVFTIAVDGRRLAQLTKAGRNIEPSWSPDGKKIIYAHEPGIGPAHLPDLWVMNATGANKRALVRTKLWESEPDWGTAAPVS